jgi:hypothetical protein
VIEMKKFIIILCLLVMLVPTLAFATSSPTVGFTRPYTKPELMFIYADTQPEWPSIEERIEEEEGFARIVALQVCLDKHYEEVHWGFSTQFTSEHEPFMLMINDEAIEKRDVGVDSDGMLVTDFSEFEPGIYILCFYVKTGVSE